MKNKNFVVKIYDKTGSTFLTSWHPKIINGEPQFSAKVNGGYGEYKVGLLVPFDDFADYQINYMNIVKIYVQDENNKTGRLVYTGYISTYNPSITNSEEGIEVTILGLISLLSLDFYRTGGGSYTVAHVAEDPADIIKAIIDHFNTIYSGDLINYDGSSIDDIGTDVDYTFEDKTWIDAIEDIFGSVGSGNWYWFIDASGKFWLKQRAASAEYAFTINKDIDNLDAPQNSEEVKNVIVVRYDGGEVTASDATSISNYGRRAEIINDQQLKNATAANQRAAKELEDRKDPKTKVSFSVNSEFDIETVMPGKTCKIRNYNINSSLFTDNMFISAIRYTLDSLGVTIDELDTFGDELEKFIS